MATKWGRNESIIWPPHVPIRSYTAIAGVILCTCLFVWQRLHFTLTPLQQSYISEYVRSEIGATFHAHQSYRLVYLAGVHVKPRLALPVDLSKGKTTLPNGRVTPVALTELPLAQGYLYPFRGPTQKLSDEAVSHWLRGAIFDNHGVMGTFMVSWIEGGVCLVFLLWFTTAHAVLLARLPQDRQPDAFAQCWRKDWQDKDGHLLPAKHLSAWIESNLYLDLSTAPFDVADAALFPEAGACGDCPKHSGYNTRLFADVAEDMCLDAACWKQKSTRTLDNALAAKPQLVQIETTWNSSRERRDGALRVGSYTLLTVTKKQKGPQW